MKTENIFTLPPSCSWQYWYFFALFTNVWNGTVGHPTIGKSKLLTEQQSSDQG